MFQDYNQSVRSSKSIQKAIDGSGRGRCFHYYQDSPRMIPQGLHPSIHKMHITVKERSTKQKKGAKKKQTTSVLSMLRKS